jgi:hypothetical protein
MAPIGKLISKISQVKMEIPKLLSLDASSEEYKKKVTSYTQLLQSLNPIQKKDMGAFLKQHVRVYS